MRILLLAALLLTACSDAGSPVPDPAPGMEPGLFFANERDGLCIVGSGKAQRAGFISYGKDNANCSASGKVVGTKGTWFLQPVGDAECRIPLTVTAKVITLGAASAACAYYCASGLSFAGRSFEGIGAGKAIPRDLAGDPLC